MSVEFICTLSYQDSDSALESGGSGESNQPRSTGNAYQHGFVRPRLRTAVVLSLWRTALEWERMGGEAGYNPAVERLKVILRQDMMGMALRAIDPQDPRWLSVNSKLCEILGYSREELLQLTSIDLSPAGERDLANEENERLLRGDITNYSREERFLRKDGSEVWTNLWLSAVPGPDGKPTHAIVFIDDITEQKKVQAAAMESEARFRAIFDNSPICVNLKDTEGRFLFANKRYEDWWGRKAEEVIGKTAHEPCKDPTAIEALIAAEKKALQTKAPYEYEIWTKHPQDNSQFHNRRLTKFPVKTPDGSVIGLGTFAVDITKSRREELQLIRHSDHLQQLVDRATEELKAKADALKQALAKEKELNKLQQQFASTVSHELRTPLSTIDSAAQRLGRRLDKGLLTPEDAARRIDKIRSAVGRMTRIMERTLTSARLEAEKSAIALEPCDIAKVIAEVCERQQEIAQSHVISIDVTDLPGTIQADTGSVEQVLTNLLSNAVKYAPDSPDIQVVARTEGQEVVISVRDHGIGIDQEELSHVGERFFRAKTSAGIAGTGIGLNLAKTLIDMHGGAFNVESVKGEGSTFTFRLPIAGPGQAG